MKCSGNSKDGSPCDYTSEKPFRFCPQCGESPLIEIPCPGRDNEPCGEPITVKFTFCPGCGLKIDQTLFTKPRKKCPQCDVDVPEGKKFCAECGARITSTNSDSDKDENKNKKTTQQDEADINANASGVAEPFKVSYPPVGIQETSLTSEPKQHQQPADIAPSNPASIVSTVIPEPKQHQQPTDTVPSNPASNVSTVTRESKQHQQPTDRVPTNTASNVSYVTIVQAETSPNMKRSISPELMTDPKKTRSTSNLSNDAGSVSYNLSTTATTTSADTTKTADKTAAATAIVASDIATMNVIPNELVATDPDSSHGEGHLRDGRNSQSNISGVDDSSGNNIADRVKKGRNVISNQAEIEGLSNTNNSNSKTLVGSKATYSTTDPLSRNTPKEVEDTADSSNAKSFENKGGQIQSNNEDKKPQTYSSVAAKSTTNKNASQNKKGGKGAGKEAVKGKPNARKSARESDVEVVFHALISEEMKLDRKEEDVYIRFGPPSLGGFENSVWKMDYFREAMDGVHEYIAHIPMSRDQRNKTFKYKYIIQTSPGDVRWEEPYYRKKAYHGSAMVNRQFDLPSTWKQMQGVWHQYDGFVYPKKEKGWWNAVKSLWKGSFEDKILADTELATELFMPSKDEILKCLSQELPQESKTAEDLLRVVFMVFSSMKVQMLDRDLRNADDDLRTKVFLKFFKPLQEHLLMGLDQKSPVSPDRSRLVLASFLLLLAWENDMSHILQTDKRLPQAFLPQPDFEKKECSDIASLKNHFRAKASKELVDCLRWSISQHCQNFSYGSASHYQQCAESQWLYLVPLLHFLRKDSEPFKTVFDTDHTKRTWWGHEDIDRTKDTLKGLYKWSIPAGNIAGDLEHLFEVDHLLPRTLMACVSSSHLLDADFLNKIPPEVTSATICYYLKAQYYTREGKVAISKQLQVVAQTYRQRWERMKDMSLNARVLEQHMAQANLGMRTAFEVFTISLKERYEITDLVVSAANLFLSSLWDGQLMYQDVKLTPQLQIELNKCVEYHHSSLRGTIDMLLTWLDRRFDFFQVHYVKRSLEFWNELVNVTVAFPAFQKEWKDTLLDAFEKILSKMKPHDCLELHMEDYQTITLSTSLEERMTSAAFSSFDKLVKDGYFNSYSWTTMSKKFGELMSKLLERHWPQDETTETQVMEFVLSWKPLKHYFERFYTKTNPSELLSVDCIAHLTQTATLLDSLKDDLCSGNITIPQLRLILGDSHNFLQLWVAVKTNFLGEDEKQFGKEHLQYILQARDRELKSCELCLQKVKILLKMCVHIVKVDSNALYERATEVDKMLEVGRVKEICKPLNLDMYPGSLENYQVRLCVFDIPDEVLAIVPELEKWRQSMIFQKIWEQKASDIQQGTDLNMAILKVWNTVKSTWLSLCTQFANGSATFRLVQKHVLMFDRDSKKIKREFKLMSADVQSTAWIEERVMQLSSYEVLQDCQKAADIILDIKDIYDISGNFAPVQAVKLLGSNRDQPMSTMDGSVLKTCDVLKGLNDETKQACIKAFKDSKQLVDWLRDSMKDGVKELKVFVDLAFISAGEEPMEIHKVNCFHSATTGYAPLIFNTPQTADYDSFLKNCELVWQELRSDRKLPEKLVDTCRHLRWLKEVKQSHGSVEVTALTQASMINTRGLYRIGHLNKLDTASDMMLTNVISLHVSKDTEDNTSRKYSYDQLVDLQSRLMLVAGQAEIGNENVDHFIMVLDGIVRLAKTYIRLCTDGCVLFNCWKGKFLCGEDTKVCTFLEFGQGDNLETLKGHRGVEGVGGFIHALANEFEVFHDEWMNYVSNRRDEYLELNFYTIDQLVFLQRELIKLGTEEEPSVRVYSMLSLIKPDCTQADLTDAMQAAQDAVFTKDKDTDKEMEVDVPLEESDLKQAFINAMLETNFSNGLARLALEAIGPDDIDSGIVWCMEHQEEESEEETEVRASSVDPPIQVFGGWHSGGESVSSSAVSWVRSVSSSNRNITTVETLTSNLRSVWKTFLEAVSSSVADYLSLEHLGIILRQLAQTDHRTFKRTIPPPLKPGISNLIVCPQADMLNAVVYMYKHSEEEPLPQHDEVLLCTPQTTFDQVDIFLRRAFFSNPGKLYTMANADLLQYEIEERAEKKLKEYANREEGLDYQLVILCSTENEFKARIVAALERQRCPPPPLQHLEDIRHYLQLKFSQKYEKRGMTSASGLDFDGSTVRVIKSKRAGVGKTLYKKRQVEALQRLNPRVPATSVSIHLYEKSVSTMAVAEKLLDHTLQSGQVLPRIFHLDISYEVQEGVDYLLFNLLVLGSISNNMGHVWLKSPLDLYLVETIPITDVRQDRRASQRLIHSILEVLPDVFCWSPQDSQQILTTDNKPEDYSNNDRLFDDIEFQSQVYQRPFQYLKRMNIKANLAEINPAVPEGSHQECLNVLLQHCGVRDPAWSELHNFVWFLNTQLVDFENSIFCSDLILEDLPGFPVLVLHFLIQMSRDFATRSLVMSEESPLDQLNVQEREEDLAQFQMKRTWESSPHPYIFFNPDGHTMTFLGFNIDRQTGNMVDQQTQKVLERNLVPKPLQEALIRNRVNINENFDQMQRLERLAKLCSVMPGVDFVHDPDDTYELTTDNVKKILAIYMRFRCGIPVIIMGETGCGKTRLVKFMCALQCMPGSDMKNMVIMKVHGGTTSDDIIKKVKHAEQLAIANKARNPHMYTVLFFDEANTTEAIGIIKEIMCDGCMNGQPLKLSENLKIVAACNPYRKHSDELIQRLEKAGLGYHVDADKTTDKLGHVPMRRLVYRVQPLPQSMLPLVWDFGQLNIQVEELYIRQMVNRYVRNDQIPLHQNMVNVVSKILIASQEFMRKQEDECSFVSLRDVDRTLSVMSWFYQQSQENGTLFEMIDDDLCPEKDPEEEEEETVQQNNLPSDVTKALILALSVCYRASLRSREEYDQHIFRYFQDPCGIPGGIDQMVQVINSCQRVFVDEVQLEDNIAKNQALKENLFMMVVCIELRIPLFLVGKPGSSKSLAKTIVADAMQGNSARSELFKQLKQAQMVSFQCSPLATAEGIVGTFRQCARYQQDKDLDRFVSIVVLDEVGLAEDSPRMPLKTLHPLLEDGCQGDEAPELFKKVAFIGISNWALDPAKMNRGILVQREAPNDWELVESAKGICSANEIVLRRIKPLLPELANAYKTIFHRAQDTKREFFGLRDFYSLVKMVYAFADKHDRDICWHQLVHAVRRNFGGLDNLDPVVVFRDKIGTVQKLEEKHHDDPDSTTIGLIEDGLLGDGTSSESRYLLLLTENYGALSILQQEILARHKVITIFGSSFPKDQEYTQVCRNINRIKVCMETGSTVILLNLENLYESLYDALNQYYARLGGERFVDLGLGTHRVKCRVHQNFKLIVVAEKQKVYEEFPIPLINRLEKHFLTLNNMMSPEQIELSQKLEKWAVDFVTFKTPPLGRRPKKGSPGDAFMGYHPDTAAAVVLQVLGREDRIVTIEEEMFKECQQTLLWCATPASVVRLAEQKLYLEAKDIHTLYWRNQKHDDIFQYLQWKIVQLKCQTLQAQVTTHSKLLTDQEKEDLSIHLSLPPNNIILLTLQSFDTEQQFAQQIKNFVQRSVEGQKLLLVQCGSGDRNQSLIRSAQYCVLDELHDARQFAVVFIIQLPNIAGGCFSGFQAGKWHSLHLDELRPPTSDLPSMEVLHQNSPSSILEGLKSNMPPTSVQPSEQRIEPMEYEEDLMGNLDDQEGQNTRQRHSELMEVDESVNYRRQDPLEMDDITLEGMTSMTDTVAPYFQHLLLPCIQSAAALIRDVELDTKRSTKRIEILLKLLDNTDNEDAKMFMQGLSKLIISLLKEKEESQTGILPTNWLSKEAARPENVRKAGTFRRAAIQCLENKMTPVLARVLAFLDTSRNLDFMHAPDVAPWTKRLWLALLNNTTVCHDQCKRIITPGNQSQQSEVVPHHFGVSKLVFSVQMPFFWLLFEGVQLAIGQSEDIGNSFDQDSHDSLSYVENIVNKTPYGEVLSSVVRKEEKSGVVRAYLEDFVHTLYFGKTDEFEILCHAFESAARQRGRDLDCLGIIRAVVYIHVIHSAAKERLQLFLEVVQVWPEVVTAVIDLKERVGGNPLLTDDEMTLDVLSLTLLMEQLEPSKDELNTDKGRSDWMDRVKTYLPVIGRIFKATDTELTHGNVCLRAMNHARCSWMRVMTMKLFLESFTGNKKVQLETRCMPLWKMLGEQTDLTKLESLEKVEKFLKIVNKSVVKKISGKIGTCSHCESEYEAPPVELPCKDKICLRCFNDIQATRDLCCPICNSTISKKFQPGSGPSQQKEVFKEYQEYQKCCNSFLMSVVSKLCFGGTEPPESAVIERIFSYITRTVEQGGSGQTEERLHTKQMSVFDDMIDPTPVVRSFLLQLLIHKSEDMVQTYLQDFFLQAKNLCEQERRETSQETKDKIVQFSLLVIHCFEDLYHEKGSQIMISSEEMRTACFRLSEGRSYILSSGLDMAKLFIIAQCRYGLSVTAKYLHAVFVNKRPSVENFNKLLEMTSQLLSVQDTEWPKKFLVKQICREFGTDSYHAICDTGKVPWLALDVTEQVKECPDRFVVCLENTTYQKVREALAKTLLGEDIKHLKQLVKDNEMLFLLAIHREVTMRNINPQTQAQSVEEVAKFIETTKEKVTQKETALRLLRNQLGRPGSCLTVRQGQSMRDQSVMCLLVHAYITLTHFNKATNFMKPLTDLILAPQTMMNKLFPTMPQDDTDVIRQSLAREGTIVFFQCPNGHPYAIGECGRPYTEATCNICGSKIGGLSHIAATGNTQHTGDQTRPGHVLGRAADRTSAYAGERRLGGAVCAVLRFFTHAALLLGAENNPQAVAALVYPQLQQDTSQFFLEHLQKDLQIIHLATGKSVDDVFLLLHFICHQISQSEVYRRMEPQELVNKQVRETWEEQFANSFIGPVLQDLDNCLNTCNERIMKDKRIGQDKLMSILYEVDTSTPQQVDCLHEFPAVWRYRSRITLEHFLREFHLKVENSKGKKSKMEVLSLFRQEHPFLQALHHIPNILRLQQYLMAKYRRRLDRVEAKRITIADAAEEGSNSIDVLEHLSNFTAAWECVKEGLHSYGCWTVHDGLIHLPDAYKNMRIEENSPLAVLLPSTQGPGICSYMMLEFLFRKHNEFMEKYCNKTKQKYEHLPEVNMRKLHSNHLVSYHPDRDLLPLVLANCNYSFELGKGTTIEYDFEGFEYQLKEVILQAKSRVEKKSHIIPIDTMVYRADTTNSVVFKTLRDRIDQESLSPAVKVQIVSELKSSLPDICDSINNLDITTSFLKSLGGDPDKSLQTFMTDVLKMKQTITSQKARQFCRFKHIQSLWLLLSFEKSVVLAQHAQDAFDDFDNELKEGLPDDARAHLKQFCQNKNLEKLEYLLQQMFDCLLLRVAQPVDPNDQEAIDLKRISLRDILQGDRDAPLYCKEPDETLTEEDILTFPADILGKHIPDTWLSVLRELTQRRKEFQ
ncbi:E3 ubiquitin-protein ligase rnf213-alpha-like [Haliotis rufescens]|uniref:E3 ubiquitin-protein ligase rnf213-alpha-like n=1 Tax=Haliotis rufescens TaxID=6454 RepID=UPI00201E786F|nr:E3 ubiquitin-protein ligase rnf213-alpha-like [Haliotis rufescens]XP_048239632.1 E3 ubiquitin-protein ligase rnf213-alpha-like [Haliotis rufescens]